MANINLLPWRAELRKQRQREFSVVIGLVALAAAGVVYAVNNYFDSAIQYQQHRNQFLQTEMKVLDDSIREIAKLRDTRSKLIERMRLIQDLQGDRPIIVHVFDQMVRAVPEDLYFTAASIQNTHVTIKGMAKSNNRVAALMRNFDQSDWFADPSLVRVQSRGEGANEFEISMTRVKPMAKEE